MNHRLILVIFVLAVSLSTPAQRLSDKRGLCWDEKAVKITDKAISAIAPGVLWIYNWGPDVQGYDAFRSGSTLTFAPMAWNGAYDEARIRTYLKNHPGTRYLLGFNEPNFSAQSNMTPTAAAAAWPKLEQIAKEYGVKLVAPALNFSGEQVGGRTWNPYEWLDAFLAARPDAVIDCLALHCYMNWASALNWFATEYFYKDLYDPTKKDVYGKYPHIVDYFAKHGKKPMMLTEFCAWEGNKDGYTSSMESQIDQMTQKLQYLETDTLVEGYAWFIAHGNAASMPYNAIYASKTAGSADLTDLGKVYVNMSSFDTSLYYHPSETIQAKDYVDASMNDIQVRLRPATDVVATGSELQTIFRQSAWATYQVEVPSDGDYTLTVRCSCEADGQLSAYVDRKLKANAVAIASTHGSYADRELTLKLTAGKHQLMLFNPSTTVLSLGTLTLKSSTNGIALSHQSSTINHQPVYDVEGRRVEPNHKGITIINHHKVINN